MDEVQRILIGKEERIYREYRDADNELTDPTAPIVNIYDPTGDYYDSGSPLKESTGIYYFSVTLPTASSTEEGVYQAYWEGTINSVFVTMDEPQYFRGTRVPWQVTEPDNIIQSLRRLIGDIDPDNYKVSNQDLYYYLSDAVDEVQAEYSFGYSITITPTSVTWNLSLYSTPFVLFKLKTQILVLESMLMDSLYDAGAVKIGDIQIDVTKILQIRMQNLERLKKDYKDLMYSVKTNSIDGSIIDTYATGRLSNTTLWDAITYE